MATSTALIPFKKFTPRLVSIDWPAFWRCIGEQAVKRIEYGGTNGYHPEATVRGTPPLDEHYARQGDLCFRWGGHESDVIALRQAKEDLDRLRGRIR